MCKGSGLDVATPTRFERATYRLGICRSILLSYGVLGRNQYLRARFCNRLLAVWQENQSLREVRGNLDGDACEKPGRRIASKEENCFHEFAEENCLQGGNARELAQVPTRKSNRVRSLLGEHLLLHG